MQASLTAANFLPVTRRCSGDVCEFTAVGKGEQGTMHGTGLAGEKTLLLQRAMHPGNDQERTEKKHRGGRTAAIGQGLVCKESW